MIKTAENRGDNEFIKRNYKLLKRAKDFGLMQSRQGLFLLFKLSFFAA
jgi:hypothetical protein